jgi:hypothetical protein
MINFSPEYNKDNFNCPHCGVYAVQSWGQLGYSMWNNYHKTSMYISRCAHCQELSFWLNNLMIMPTTGTVEHPNLDIPKDCKRDYNEARDIVNISPRGATALLRLCIQKLMKHLGKTGKNINEDIAELVKEGLPALIQQSLDICRVVGNNAVHPGEINLEDSPEIALSLFKLVNIIIEDRITKPKEVVALYASLPASAINAIRKRDGA